MNLSKRPMPLWALAVSVVVSIAISVGATAIAGQSSAPLGPADVAGGPSKQAALGSSHGLKYIHAKKKVAPQDLGMVSATCPKGTAVTGGGAWMIPTLSADGWLELSAPFDSHDKGKAPDDGWVAFGWNNETGNQGEIDVWAICQK